MEIRDATPADVPHVREVAQEAWQAAYAAFLTPGQCRRALDDLYDAESLERAIEELDGFHLLVAEVDGEVLGFASAEKTWADEAELYALYVHPDHWGEGVGSALLEAGIDRLPAAATALKLEVFADNDVGRRFYEARGFDRVGETDVEVAGDTYRAAIYALAI